jgi:hypothetical protein
MYDAVRLRACAACVAYDRARVTAENGAAVSQKVQTLLIDDLDGSAAEGTVRFGLDGMEYEIDLNAEVRVWAKAQGIEVKDRGRVPAELVVKFKAASGR